MKCHYCGVKCLRPHIAGCPEIKASIMAWGADKLREAQPKIRKGWKQRG